MNNKVFIGAHIPEDVRDRFQIACILNKTQQNLVIEQLILNWIKRPHIDTQLKELANGTEKDK